MLNLEEIRARLVDANLKKVAEKAGVHEARVYRLMSGETEPMYETVKALSDYLEGKDRVDARSFLINGLWQKQTLQKIKVRCFHALLAVVVQQWATNWRVLMCLGAMKLTPR